jgi:hypothetical protein
MTSYHRIGFPRVGVSSITDAMVQQNCFILNNFLFILCTHGNPGLFYTSARVFHLERSLQQNASSSETESTASDMSDLSYEQELDEVGEVDVGPLQHRIKLTT